MPMMKVKPDCQMMGLSGNNRNSLKRRTEMKWITPCSIMSFRNLKKPELKSSLTKRSSTGFLNREAFLQKSVKNLSAGEAKAYFTFDREDAERFNKILDDWENKEKNPFLLIQVGKIPPVMKALGIADKLIEIESGTIAKVLRPEPVYPNDKQGHNLTMDDVRAVPDLLADPIMVFKSRRREDSYVFFTERRDFKDRSIIIPIAVNKRKGRIIINEITSMYGRNNEIDYVYSNAEGGYLVYMDKKRTEEWEKKKQALRVVVGTGNNIQARGLLSSQGLTRAYSQKNDLSSSFRHASSWFQTAGHTVLSMRVKSTSIRKSWIPMWPYMSIHIFGINTWEK